MLNTKQAKEGCSKKKLMGEVNIDEFTGPRTPTVTYWVPWPCQVRGSLTRNPWGAQGAAMPRKSLLKGAGTWKGGRGSQRCVVHSGLGVSAVFHSGQDS